MPKNLRIGLAGEYLAASHLARLFDDVFTAPSSSRFDFLCHKNNQNFKIQVKTTDSTFNHHGSDWVRWDIKKKKTNTKEYRTYDGEEVDIFAFVFLSRDKVIFEPNYNLGKTYQKKVEYIKTVNSQESLNRSVNLILEIKNNITEFEEDIKLKEQWQIK
jgi:hypothetical protein